MERSSQILCRRLLNQLDKFQKVVNRTTSYCKIRSSESCDVHFVSKYQQILKNRYGLMKLNSVCSLSLAYSKLSRPYSTDESKHSDSKNHIEINKPSSRTTFNEKLSTEVESSALGSISDCPVNTDRGHNPGQSSDSDSVESSSEVPDTSESPHTTAVDIDRELLRYNFEEYEDFDEISEDEEEEEEEVSYIISPERGSSDVYDIEDMVELLEKENAQDLCVISVPKEINYVDYMVIASGKSQRHLQAITRIIKKMYKVKRRRGDPSSVQDEGTAQSGWIALDLGNMAVHLMTPALRDQYDLETLWTVGNRYDDNAQKEVDVNDMSISVPDMWDWNKPEQQSGELVQGSGNEKHSGESERRRDGAGQHREYSGLDSTNWHRR